MSPTNDLPDGEVERLRRHLRALSAVNRQLQAQVESGTLRGGSRARAADGGEWIEQLQLMSGGADPFLVRSPKRGAFLVEGSLRRRINAGLLAVALESVLGAAREVGDAELDRWKAGPPVEVLEGGSGPAFLIVGGRRLSLRGLPLPYPVTVEEMSWFPEGEELRVGGQGGRVKALGRLARARTLLRREGFRRSVARLFSRVSRPRSHSERKPTTMKT